MIGKTVSHYEITGELGTGGMGAVYRARDRIDQAAATLAAGSDFNFLAMWEGNYAQAHFELGRAAAMIRDCERAMSHLANAVRLGWRNGRERAGDPVFKVLEHRDDFCHLRDLVRNTDPLP